YSCLGHWFSICVMTPQKAMLRRSFLPSETRRALRVARDVGSFRPGVAFANSRHRHRITRPQRENRSDGARLEMCALSGADGPCASPLHARSLRTSPENASNLRLVGGAEWIRTLGSACLAGKRPIFSIF